MPEGEKPGIPEPVDAPAVIQPLMMNIVGIRTAGTGAPITDGQEIVTPAGQPNLIANVITPIVAIGVRAVRTFLETLLGGLGVVGGATVTGTLPWATWEGALAFAGSAALVNIIWSCSTIFGDLEKKHPLLTGSI